MRNRILLSLVSVALTAYVVGSGTMALFTASSSPVNGTLASGTLSISAAGGSWSTYYDRLAPAQSVSNTLTVANTGTLNLMYRMYAVTDPNNPLAQQLEVRVSRGSTVVKTWTPLLGFTSGAPLVQSLAAGGSPDTLTVEVRLPETATNAARAQSVAVTFQFNATQPSNINWE